MLSFKAAAIFTGALRNALAETIAALEAKSPWEVSAGISTVNPGISVSGSFPSCIALINAFFNRLSTSDIAS